jgi:hypothetical protein
VYAQEKEQAKLDEIAANQQSTLSPAPERGTSDYAQFAWDVATNPMTAAGYKLRGQEIPYGFKHGEINLFEPAISMINPFAYIDSGTQLANDLTTLETYTDPEKLLYTGLDAASMLPITRGASTYVKNLEKSINPSYIGDIIYSAKKGKLPEYKTAVRWQSDNPPNFASADKLTDEQKALTGSWFGYKPENTDESEFLHSLGFYPDTRPGSGSLHTLRLSDRQIANLESSMPASAKGMSGKYANVAESDEYMPGELIIPESLRSKAKKLEMSVNPSNYGPSLYKETKIYDDLMTENMKKYGNRYLTGKFLNDVILTPMQQDIRFGNITIPRKHLPFKYGGWLDKYQDGSQTGPRISNLPKQEFKPTPNFGPGHPSDRGYTAREVPGALGSMTTIWTKPGERNLVLREEEERQQAMMDRRGDADRVFMDLNPLTAVGSGAFYGASNIAQGNILEGALEAGLTSPLIPRIISKSKQSPKSLPGSPNTNKQVIENKIGELLRQNVEPIPTAASKELSTVDMPYSISRETLSPREQVYKSSIGNDESFWNDYNLKKYGVAYPRAIPRFYDPTVHPIELHPANAAYNKPVPMTVEEINDAVARKEASRRIQKQLIEGMLKQGKLKNSGGWLDKYK